MEVGFEISKSLSFRETIRLSAELKGGEFSINHDEFEPGTNYYYRAFARNKVGESPGVSKRLKIPALPQANAWWSKMQVMENGWIQSAWFGAFQPTEHQWLYHSEMGWLYPSPMVDGSLWLWNQADGWRWTQEGVYPYLFRWRDSAWIYLQGRISGRLIYYNYSTQSYE